MSSKPATDAVKQLATGVEQLAAGEEIRAGDSQTVILVDSGMQPMTVHLKQSLRSLCSGNSKATMGRAM